jgi:hypothetical protein
MGSIGRPVVWILCGRGSGTVEEKFVDGRRGSAGSSRSFDFGFSGTGTGVGFKFTGYSEYGDVEPENDVMEESKDLSNPGVRGVGEGSRQAEAGADEDAG